MEKSKKINLNGIEVRTIETKLGEYLCITDLAKVAGDNTGEILNNWLRLVGTIEFLKEFESKFNQHFNFEGYDDLRRQAGTVRFRLSAKKWLENTGAIGIISKAGRFGGTYAHNAIALEFCSVISPAFKLGVYVDYLTLKENAAQSLLESYSFFMQKIEDNTLEANRYAQDFNRVIEETKKTLDKE